MNGQPSEPEDTNNEPATDAQTTNRSLSPAFSLRTSFLAAGFRSVLSGEISARVAARELVRRGQAIAARRRERQTIDELTALPAQLLPEFQSHSPSELLDHFRERGAPSFLAGFADIHSTSELQREVFPEATRHLLEAARRIAREHRWALLGFGEQKFGESINWNRDPLSGRLWPLDYHAAISLWRNDGSDIRVVWELNRLGHLITLGRAYALTGDRDLAEEFFGQIESWREQNPLGRGANWACAMEVALRAMNLLAAFSLFRRSPALTEERLRNLLTLLDQHGRHIKRNLEFSYLATSNHYLSDVAGLLWLGIMLPELSAAAEWRSWAMAEMLREMDEQILPDGADHERSTGYHRFVLELFLYSFILCDANEIAIEEKYWQKLRAMFVYVRGILRPDGCAPLIGDTDGGQVLPIVSRSADDHAYLLPFAAAIFEDNTFKLPDARATEELLWVLGSDAVSNYQHLAVSTAPVESQSFPDAGTYVLRKDDLYLLFNLGGAAGKGPASHVHNDSLSIEVSAHGRAFLVDPGAYVYTADLEQRHVFRSTGYHSTVQVDDAEQNTTNQDSPFAIGNEARGRLLKWETGLERDHVSAEHAGYGRLGSQLIHRRSVTFEKTAGWWLIEDEISGEGEHTIAVRFHFDAGLEVEALIRNDQTIAMAWDKMAAEASPKLLVCAIDVKEPLRLEDQFTSKHYGSRLPSISASWSTRMSLPCKLRWAIVPVGPGESIEERLKAVQSPTSNVQSLQTETLDFGR
ncbi:MAG TPA: alginate lyase family protein [Pyrinomonadaceae bacterium]|nr:alginate lyase family protein [Pyrinomonadaceae bacterium]